MKRFILFSSIAILMVSACGGPEKDDNGKGEEIVEDTLDYSGMNEISLKEQGLNMKIMLPEVASSTGASIEPKVEHDDGDYLWHIKIGSRFHLVIEDFGKEKNKVTNEKARLADLDKIFICEYLVDELNIIMYKRTLHKEQGGKPSYHVYGETTVDSYTYVLRSQEDGGLKPIIDDMMKTIKSAKSVDEASS